MKRQKRSSTVSLALSIPTSSPQSLLREESRDNTEQEARVGLCAGPWRLQTCRSPAFLPGDRVAERGVVFVR